LLLACIPPPAAGAFTLLFLIFVKLKENIFFPQFPAIYALALTKAILTDIWDAL